MLWSVSQEVVDACTVGVGIHKAVGVKRIHFRDHECFTQPAVVSDFRQFVLRSQHVPNFMTDYLFAGYSGESELLALTCNA